MKILVAGAGALGSVFGGLLSLRGHSVTLLGKGPHIEAIRDKGLAITGIWGNYTAKACRVWFHTPSPAEVFDLVLLCVKSYDTEHMAQKILPCFDRNALVISLQNGLNNYEALVKFIPKDRILMGRVIFGVIRPEPGRVDVTVYAEEVRIGNPENLVNEDIVMRIASLFSEAGIPTLPSSSITQYVWSKVLYNSSLNPLSALINCTYGELLENAETRDMMRKIVHEIYQVADAMKIELMEKTAEEYIGKLFGRLIPATALHRSSMLQDIMNRRRTEIDSLNGAILKIAKDRGLEVPANESLTAMIKAKETF